MDENPTMVGRAMRLYLGRRLSHWILLATFCVMDALGLMGAWVAGRFYFAQGGQQRWLYTTLQTIGWPILIPPLFITYYLETRRPKSSDPIIILLLLHSPGSIITTARALLDARASVGAPFTPTLLLVFTGLGFLTSIDNFLFTYGLSYLSVSTAALLGSSQLAFTSVFSYLLVRFRFTFGSLNAVFAITLGTVLLGLPGAAASTDIPPGTSHKQYILAVVAAIGAAALFGLILPLLELTYEKLIHRSNICVILETQIMVSLFATVFSLLGMAFSGEFSAIHGESTTFGSSSSSIYCVVLLATAVCWQLCYVGALGLVFLASALFSNLLSTSFLPIISILALAVFHDDFSSLKAIAVLLSFWGTISYAYGGYSNNATIPDHPTTT